MINDPVDNEVPLLRISIAVPSVIPSASIDINLPFVASLDCIRSIPFVGLVDFDDNLINDPVDKSVPSFLISIAVPSFNPFASIDINLPFVASLDSIRNIPFVGLVDFDVNLTNDPLDKALLFT